MFHIATADPIEFPHAPSFWDGTDRRVRCGSHIIHLAAKHFLAAVNPTNYRKHHSVTQETDDFDESDGEDRSILGDEAVWQPGDLLGKALAFVTQVW
jgi:hypothetical protein